MEPHRNTYLFAYFFWRCDQLELEHYQNRDSTNNKKPEFFVESTAAEAKKTRQAYHFLVDIAIDIGSNQITHRVTPIPLC